MKNLGNFQDLLRLDQLKKYKFARKKKENPITKTQVIGEQELAIFAGPCSVESEQQIFEVAETVAKGGGKFLRGGAFKPRTSPYSFQGLGETGLKYLQRAAKTFNLLAISEVMDSDQIELVAAYVDVLQVGSRNMQNFSLLKRLGKAKKPIFLKRGMCATYKEWLLAAEYILDAGNTEVILCERGIRTFDSFCRSTLDLAAVPILKEITDLPIIVDPSHGTGYSNIVPPMALAAIAAGADGLMLEIHPHPEAALSDGQQSLTLNQFLTLMTKLKNLAPVVQ